MPAYVIGEIEVTDPVAYEDYRRQVPAVLAAYGGRYLVRGGDATRLEGAGEPRRLVVLEFPTMAQLRAFYDAPEYQPIKAIRLRASTGRLIAVEGVAPPV
jgi:uncharacterized protein (DUF1330 family)